MLAVWGVLRGGGDGILSAEWSEMDFLVVDDDKTFRDATAFLIEDEKHKARGVSSQSEALDALKNGKFDAILLDVNLGRENGLKVLAEIQQAHPGQRVVMFTAAANVKLAVEAMRQGAVDFLEKPFRRENFQEVVARLQAG